MQSFGGKDMGLDPPDQRLQHRAAGADLVGQGGEAERHAFPGIAFGLAVQRLMLAELLEQDHRQEAGAGPAARDDMERRRRLADLLAVAARELLAHVLDHLPLPRDHLQRLGDVLAELGQAWPPQQGQGRARDDEPLARQMLGKRLARGALARKGGDISRVALPRRVLGGELVLGGRRLRVLRVAAPLVESRAVRSERGPNSSRCSLAIFSFRWAIIA